METQKEPRGYIASIFREIPIIATTYLGITLILAIIPVYQVLIISNFTNVAIDIFNGVQSQSKLIIPIILVGVYMFILNVLPNMSRLVITEAENKLTEKLQIGILDKISRLEYKHIENKESQDLIERVKNEIGQKFWNGFSNILTLFSLIFSFLSMGIIIVRYTLMGAIVFFMSIPLIYVAMNLGKQNYQVSKEMDKIKRRYNYIKEVLTDKKYVDERTLFKYQDYIEEKFVEEYEESFKLESKMEKRTYFNMKVGSVVALLIIGGMLAVLVLNLESMSVGLFVAIVGVSFNLIQSMSWQLSGAFKDYVKGRKYIEDVKMVYALSEKEGATEESVQTTFKVESIEFKKVGFKYPETESVIVEKCSFKLEGHKTYALVGKNGAGKSTIIKLLIGMYDDYEGEILLNGQDIKTYDYGILKGIFGVTFQDFYKYNQTIKETIEMGNNFLADEKKIEKIIEKVNLDEVVNKLELGINTPLGKIEEGGIDLSGGQWQKLNIARILYSEAEINILDEPTASLDPMAESEIYRLFGKVASSEAMNIIITHRLGASSIADEILVLKDGQIEAKENHETLMESCSTYREMYDLQKSWYVRD